MCVCHIKWEYLVDIRVLNKKKMVKCKWKFSCVWIRRCCCVCVWLISCGCAPAERINALAPHSTDNERIMLYYISHEDACRYTSVLCIRRIVAVMHKEALLGISFLTHYYNSRLSLFFSHLGIFTYTLTFFFLFM